MSHPEEEPVWVRRLLALAFASAFATYIIYEAWRGGFEAAGWVKSPTFTRWPACIEPVARVARLGWRPPAAQ